MPTEKKGEVMTRVHGVKLRRARVRLFAPRRDSVHVTLATGACSKYCKGPEGRSACVWERDSAEARYSRGITGCATWTEVRRAAGARKVGFGGAGVAWRGSAAAWSLVEAACAAQRRHPDARFVQPA